MPHFAKPWFRPSRRAWYVQVDGKQINLGPDKDQAFERYHELMRHRPKDADCSLVIGVLDAFLSWVKDNKAERTFEWYRRHLEAFARTVPQHLAVGKLKELHVSDCLSRHPDWSSTNKNGLCRAVQRAFRWAEKQGRILKSPLAGIEKPKSRRREVVITEEEFLEILAAVPSAAFRDLLTVAWETGARPQELLAVEARHADLALARWVFPVQESKGQKLPRIVYLSDAALEITRRLKLRHPTGPLFRNEDGRCWNRNSVHLAFDRLRVILGLRRMKALGVTVERLPRFRKAAVKPDELEQARAEQEGKLRARRKALYNLARTHARKHCLYHFRHSWATRALRRGLDPLTVAILLGHSDPSMLAKVYQHLAQDPAFLQQAARRASAEVPDRKVAE